MGGAVSAGSGHADGRTRRGRGGGCAVPRHPGTRWLNAGFSALSGSAVSLPSPQLCPPVSLGSVGIFQSPPWPLSHLNTAFWQVPASSPRRIHRSPPSPGFPRSASPWRSPVLGGRSPGPVPASPPPQTSLHSRPRPGPRVHLAELNPPLLGLPLPKASSGGRGTERAPRPGVAGWPVASQTGSGRVRVHRQASLQTPRLNVMQFSRVTKMSPFDSFQPFKNQTSLAHIRSGGSLVWSLGCQRRTPSLPAVGTPGAGLSSRSPGSPTGNSRSRGAFPASVFFFFNFFLKRSWHTRVY